MLLSEDYNVRINMANMQQQRMDYCSVEFDDELLVE